MLYRSGLSPKDAIPSPELYNMWDLIPLFGALSLPLVPTINKAAFLSTAISIISHNIMPDCQSFSCDVISSNSSTAIWSSSVFLLQRLQLLCHCCLLTRTPRQPCAWLPVSPSPVVVSRPTPLNPWPRHQCTLPLPPLAGYAASLPELAPRWMFLSIKNNSVYEWKI